MTREEKEQTGKYVLQMARLLEDGSYQQEMLLKAVRIIDEALEQESRWIPVSERLPKIADVYRVTRRYTNNVMNPEYLVDACFFDGFNTWYNDNRINHERAYADNIIAWQENPEPYKVEPQEDEEKLKGKVIIDAEITGSYVILKLNDGAIFEYEASDGGYSAWNWKESEEV